jgi:hypothetical protein
LLGAACLALSAHAAPLGHAAQAIVNGQRAPRVVPMTTGEQAAVGWLFPWGAQDAVYCTGTLIAPGVVLTAAHCVNEAPEGVVGFGTGMMPAAPDAMSGVLRHAIHPTADLALLALESTPATATPIAPNDDPLSDRLVGVEVEVAGYGDTRTPDLTGRFFAVVAISGVDREYVTVDGRGVEGLCSGDSGGPVLAVNAEGRVVVFGVEHGGEISCVGRDQLTRTDVYAEWIAAETEALQTGCAGLDYAGRCDGAVAVWCDDGGRAQRLDCAAEGRVCGFVDDATGFYCKSGAPCPELPAGGVCDGSTRLGCADGAVVREDCGLRGALCVVDATGAVCAGGQAVTDAGVTGPGADADTTYEGACTARPGRARADVIAWPLLLFALTRAARRRRL